MKTRLGVATCDKRQQPTIEDEHIMIVVESNITHPTDAFTFDGSRIDHL